MSESNKQPPRTRRPASRNKRAGTLPLWVSSRQRVRNEWTGEILEPPPGVDYTRVFAGPPQRAATAVGGLVSLLLSFVLVFPLIVQLVLGIGFLLRGRPGTFTEYMLDATAFRYPEGMLAAHLGLATFIPIVFGLARFLHQRRPHWVSSVQPGLRWRYLLLSALVSLIVLGGLLWVTNGGTFTWDPDPNLVVWLALIVITSPVQAAAEEYMFRGYLNQVLGGFIANKWLVVLASALIFGFFHGSQDLPLLVNRFAFGLLMGLLVVFTGGLEGAIAAHAVNNVLAYGMAAVSGGVATARGLTSVTWEITAWNLLGYAVTGALIYGLGRALQVATRTPGELAPTANKPPTQQKSDAR